jgi:integrase
MSDVPAIKKKAMSEASACGNIKKFRTIFKHAVIEKFISENPFNQITLSYQSPRKQKLSLTQIIKFFNECQRVKNVKVNAKIFLFMSLTGTAYLDCMRLTFKNLEYTTQGVKMTYNRIKTGHESAQYLTNEAFKLLEEFDRMPDVQNSPYLIPQRCNQYLNRSLKEIGQSFGLPFPLTSHHGRHTFRSLLDEADIVDPTVISRLMGWSTRNSMDAIYRNVTDRRLLKTKQQLDDFINLTFLSHEY